jgi:hypothetical protein
MDDGLIRDPITVRGRGVSCEDFFVQAIKSDRKQGSKKLNAASTFSKIRLSNHLSTFM